MRSKISTLGVISSALILSALVAFTGCGSAEAQAPVAKVEYSENLVSIEKQGFLTVDSCAKAGEFTDCYLENYACGTNGCFKNINPGVQKEVQLVLYSHKDGITYNVDTSHLHPRELDEGINRNDVTLIGQYDEKSNTIIAHEFKAPPPPAKSFFKGCL